MRLSTFRSRNHFLCPLLLGAFTLTLITGCGPDDTADKPEFREQEHDRIVRQLVAETRADTSWEYQLANGSQLSPPIYTADMQQVWLGEPIVFTGNIEDIIRVDADTYRLILDQPFGHEPLLLGTSFRLALACKRDLVERVRARTNDEPLTASLVDNVAAVARIDRISREDPRESGIVYTGHGECLALRYIADKSY